MIGEVSLSRAGRTGAEAARRVALVEFFGIGGTADYTDCLAQALVARGLEVAVVTSSLFEPLIPDPPYEIVRPFTYAPSQPKPFKAWQLARAIGPAGKFLNAFRPDIIHAQGTVMPAIERRLYRSLASTTICTVHDARAHERRPWLGSFSAFYHSFDQLICHSYATRRQLVASLPTARIAVIPHGAYTPLAGTLPDRRESRQRLLLPPNSRVVLFFGFIRRYKGLDLLLDALTIARRLGHDVVGLVAGRPLYDIRPSVERAKRERIPIDWHLRFIPRQEFGTFFAAADVVALPYVDTFDSGALELAAAFRKPVVVTNAGGLAEAFGRYGYGALLHERSAEALASALVASYPGSPPISPSTNSWGSIAQRTTEIYEEARND